MFGDDPPPEHGTLRCLPAPAPRPVARNVAPVFVVTFLDRHRSTVFDGFVASQLGDVHSDRRARPHNTHHVADRRAARQLHGEALQHRHTQPEAVDGGVPPGAGTGGSVNA